MWQGSAGDRRPYADLTRYPEVGRYILSSDSPCWAPTDIQSGLVANPQYTLADSYLARTASPDKMLPRYNVNTFLNSATTRAFPFGSASA